MRLWLFIGLLNVFISPVTQAAPLYSLSVKSPETQALLDEAATLLPVKLKSAFKSSIQVRFKKLPHNVMGMAQSKSLLVLNQNIPQTLKNTEAMMRATGRQHKTLKKEILATVLHETTHLYDLQDVHDAQEKSLITNCRTFGSDPQAVVSPQCFLYKNIRYSVSQNPYFLESTGWTLKDNKLRSTENGFSLRSADRYELSNPQETLAVNMEYFLLDPEFKCHKPTLYRFFKTHFQHEPFKNITCESDTSFTFLNATATAPEDVQVTIPFHRVYQAQYFLADSGEAMMSNWGHTMIRLVICDPQRTEPGPECLRDIRYHLVLSYRAFIWGLQTSAMDGVMGKYPSRLFVLPLRQVIDEYTKGELRDIKSYPLNFSRTELKQFLQRAFESHWTYDGKYRFVSNNCAVEALNLVKAATWNPSLMTSLEITPKGVLHRLLQSNMALAPDFKDRNKAINDGYLFDSYKNRFDVAVSSLHKSSLKTIEDYKKLTSQERQDLITKVANSFTKKDIKKIAALMILENAVLYSQRTAVLEATAAQIIADDDKSEKLKEMMAEVQDISGLFSAPAALIPKSKSYGIPSSQELSQYTAEIYSQVSRMSAISKNLDAGTQSLQQQDFREIKVTERNIENLRQILTSYRRSLLE